ncbi:hypothetical protein AB7M56_001835 [Bradyrhizobium elkanii]|nr:hypothetical protein [Bradyrhizobium elkanii]
MSRECGCVTLWPRNAFSVVPAKAGTHNHKCKLLRDAGTTSPVSQNPPRRMGPCFRRDDSCDGAAERHTGYAGLNPAFVNAARPSSDASASRKACTAGRCLRAVTNAKS